MAHTHRRPGYTLIEISVVIVITGVLLTLVLANYNRGKVDSVLNREASLMMARLRYAQELTASGSILRYQGDWHSGASCLTNTQCNYMCTLSKTVLESCGTYDSSSPKDGIPDLADPVSSCTCCPEGGTNCANGNETPPGGFAVGFSCPSTMGDGFAQGILARESYFLVADRIKCTGTNPGGGPSGEDTFGSCWSPIFGGWDYDAKNADSDGIITLAYWGAKGDTVKEKYTVDPTVEIKDLRVTYSKTFIPPVLSVSKDSFTCTDSLGNPTKSPWNNLYVPGVPKNSKCPDTLGSYYYCSVVHDGFPIQATVRFVPPDGRVVDVNDNIYSFAPVSSGVADKNNPVKSVEVMLKLKNRLQGCTVVKVERSGAISSYNDEQCNFTAT